MKWINTTNLDAWGATRASETELPGLVSDLIRATVPDINAMRFPTGEKGQVRGFDGTLESSVAALNIPAGCSYWEFGTEKDYQAKALRDFQKRSRQVGIQEQAKATLVLVTPFTWDYSKSSNKVEDWEKSRESESQWRRVKVIDGQQLEDWLAQCPAVSAWHARNTLRVAPRDGVKSIDDYWFSFADRFSPRLLEQMLTVERGRQVETLLSDLMGPPQQLRYVADSPDEVIAFAVAAIRTATPQVQLFLGARTLVVETAAAVRELVGRSNLVFLASEEAARTPGQLAEIGPTLVPLGRQQRAKQGILLERPSSLAMAEVLTRMDFPLARAEALAKGCGRSLTALARQIPGGAAELPGWVQDAKQLLPAILPGAWDASNSLDQAVIASLASTSSYAEYESGIRKHVEGIDPALDREGHIYKIRAPLDAFIHAGHLIGREHLDALRPVFKRVSSEARHSSDPSAGLRSDSNPSNGHSDWLREGLATTLLLLALWQHNAGLDLPARQGQKFADEIIGDLLGQACDSTLLINLEGELPMLAEAAPGIFLASIERMLEGDGEKIRPIFDEVDGLVFPTSHHAGLLWALETLAWDRRHLRQVGLILARLAELDPGGSLSNRPDASLADIFLPWHPGTSAPLEVRLAVIDEILVNHSEIGFKLLLKLLPDTMRFTSGTARPRIREGETPIVPPPREDVAKAYSAVIERALTASSASANRIKDLLRYVPRFGKSHFDRFVQLIDQHLAIPSEETKELWTALRDDIRRHERFSEADWALPEAALAELRRIIATHEPTDPVLLIAELFDYHDLGRNEQAAATKRADAVTTLYRNHGAGAVLRLMKDAKMWYRVVCAIEEACLTLSDIAVLLRTSFAEDKQGQDAISLSAIYYRRAGEAGSIALLEKLNSQSGDEAVAALLLGWPYERSTWRAARELGSAVEASYWRTLRPGQVGTSRRTLLELIIRLVAHGRAIAALETALTRLDEIPTRLLLEMLDGVIPEVNSGQVKALDMLSYGIEQVMKALDLRNASVTHIARREYALLPLIYQQDRPLKLHSLMVEDPMLFHSIVRDLYRGEDDSIIEEMDLAEKVKARAHQAYRLLSSLEQVPGYVGAVPDQAALSKWIREVRELGVQYKRAAITEVMIGNVLAHAPADDKDAAWPHRYVRDEIEHAKSERLERAIQIEKYNMRGVTSRGIFDGGALELELAKAYEHFACLAAQWPRTSAMLERMAEGWRNEAEHEDASVRQRRLRS